MRKGKLWLCALAMIAFPALAQNRDDSQQARQSAVRELLLARGEDKNIEAMIETLSETYVAQLRKSYPSISAEQLQDLQRHISANLSASKDEYLNHMVAVYADYLSVQELKAATAFYQSEAGKKMVASSPSMIPQIAAYQAEWTSTAVKKATNDINASLKAPQ